MLVIGALRREKALRYNELQLQVEGISQRVHILTLKKLEQNGLVKGFVFASVPPHVDYENTLMGRTLLANANASHLVAGKSHRDGRIAPRVREKMSKKLRRSHSVQLIN